MAKKTGDDFAGGNYLLSHSFKKIIFVLSCNASRSEIFGAESRIRGKYTF